MMMDTPVRISFGAFPSTSAMETTMEWQPWFDGPMQYFGLIFALKDDYSGADLVTHTHEGTVYANGERVPDDVKYCAWMPAPKSTPRYEMPSAPQLKAVV